MRTLLTYYKKHIIFGIALIILGVFVYFYMSQTSLDAEAISYEEKPVSETTTEEVITPITVDVKGAVKKSGVYTLKEGDRIIDAINAAGGLSKNGITTNINLSKKLTNEMVVYVFTKSEYNSSKQKDCNCEVIKVNDCKSTVTTTTKAVESNYESIPCEVKETIVDNCATTSEDNSKININNADLALLETLPGIGEAKAKSIIEYRNNNGLFKDISEIKNVSGLGDALFDKIKDYITV